MENLDKTLPKKGVESERLSPEQMRGNFINRAKALGSENENLARKVMGLKWNNARKEQILNELRDCRANIGSAEKEFSEAA